MRAKFYHGEAGLLGTALSWARTIGTLGSATVIPSLSYSQEVAGFPTGRLCRESANLRAGSLALDPIDLPHRTAMTRPKLNRRGGLLAMLGSLLWSFGWILTLIAGGGTNAERVWRTLLVNPALLLFMGSLVGLHARQEGRSGRMGKLGLAVCLVAMGIMLLGNVVEFWVSEYLWGTQTPGWVMMGIGLMILPAGLILLGISTFKARVLARWSRAVPLGFGLMLGLMVMVFAGAIWTGSRHAKELLLTTIFGIALGWAALGCALWSSEGREHRHFRR